MGDTLEPHFEQMAILRDMIEAAMTGKLDAALFAKLWRARRDYRGYLIALLERSVAAGRRRHERMICESVGKRLRLRRLVRHLAMLNEADEALE